MGAKRICVLCHSSKPSAIDAARATAVSLCNSGVDVRIPSIETHIGLDDLFRSKEECLDTEMVLAFGGDGTILRTVRWLDGVSIPVLGVNLGRFGFLAGTEFDGADDLVAKVLRGGFQEQERMLLRYQVYAEGEMVAEGHVLNEVVLGRGARSRVVRLRVDVNGEHLIDYAADGVIISTPTGSTAYSLSTGGPIVSPQSRLILLNPLCPHTLFSRSMVFAPEDELVVTLQAGVELSADGVEVFPDGGYDKVVLTESDRRVRLLQSRENAFYAILRDKLRINHELYRG